MKSEFHYVYILECRDGTFYTGYTTDLGRRVSQHNRGVGAKYTRGRGPCKLIYHRQFDDKSEALKEEIRIKQLSRVEKLRLIGRDPRTYHEL